MWSPFFLSLFTTGLGANRACFRRFLKLRPGLLKCGKPLRRRKKRFPTCPGRMFSRWGLFFSASKKNPPPFEGVEKKRIEALGCIYYLVDRTKYIETALIDFWRSSGKGYAQARRRRCFGHIGARSTRSAYSAGTTALTPPGGPAVPWRPSISTWRTQASASGGFTASVAPRGLLAKTDWSGGTIRRSGQDLLATLYAKYISPYSVTWHTCTKRTSQWRHILHFVQLEDGGGCPVWGEWVREKTFPFFEALLHQSLSHPRVHAHPSEVARARGLQGEQEEERERWVLFWALARPVFSAANGAWTKTQWPRRRRTTTTTAVTATRETTTRTGPADAHHEPQDHLRGGGTSVHVRQEYYFFRAVYF